jgi:hypothetical protein
VETLIFLKAYEDWHFLFSTSFSRCQCRLMLPNSHSMVVSSIYYNLEVTTQVGY